MWRIVWVLRSLCVVNERMNESFCFGRVVTEWECIAVCTEIMGFRRLVAIKVVC